MNKNKIKFDTLVRDLSERAKELNCLYKIEEVLNMQSLSVEEIFKQVADIVPQGWQYQDICSCEIEIRGESYMSSSFSPSEYRLSESIVLRDEVIGYARVYYTDPPVTEPFLKDERKLLRNISDRLGQTILHRELREIFNKWQKIEAEMEKNSVQEWRIILNMLISSDRKLYIYITHKMLHYLCWNGIKEAGTLMEDFSSKRTSVFQNTDENIPLEKKKLDNILKIGDSVFRIAENNLDAEIINKNIHKWILEDKSRYLIKVIDNPNSSLSKLTDAITRYNFTKEDNSLSDSIKKGLCVSLIRRLLSEQLEFIDIAKKFLNINDFYSLISRIIFTSDSHGKLGGKSSGLFLAEKILNSDKKFTEKFGKVSVPKTWYITSDTLIKFIHYNNLEDVIEQKYKTVDEINMEYNNLIQIFKNSYFPPEVVKGLSLALDEFEDSPLIVRSSSLLEDRLGAAFSGKYKSLFLANQGTKQERLNALLDAVAEVYASIFGPDPIEYRKERGLLDYYEEMGIMLQEVIGFKAGDYYLPSFAGVAFSSNEFRWSTRIEREDGLVRLVPGLGTRAVDRVSDDYPVLISPGKPEMRVNVATDEILRYSPKKLDLINLKKGIFETVSCIELFREYGDSIRMSENIVSQISETHVSYPVSRFSIDFKRDELVTTFEGLFNRTDFMKCIKEILRKLKESFNTEIDIEFVHNGKNLYLLQCRAQSFERDTETAEIPDNIDENDLIFKGDKYISNALIKGISHLVYVVPEEYSKLSEYQDLKETGRIVGKLNKILPKKSFILIGPGRWGSRGDIKLGVNVTYSDINNCSAIVEVARKKGNYTPDLSFGTHFFQDLVESSIKYFPLYPGTGNSFFNEKLILKEKNMLEFLLPDSKKYSDLVRVIDLKKSFKSSGTMIMNSDQNRGIFFIDRNQNNIKNFSAGKADKHNRQSSVSRDDFWKWRLHMAEKIAENIDADKLDVKAIYLFGSTKNASAGPESDIDLIVHTGENREVRKSLDLWFDGWDKALCEMNMIKSGVLCKKILDIHYITDKDIEAKNSYAVKINAVTDPARVLLVREK